MSDALARWNRLPVHQAEDEILPCCGSQAWARAISEKRPIRDAESLLTAHDEVWRSLAESDWREAFRCHPRIGEAAGPAAGSAQSAVWSEEEQGRAGLASTDVKDELAEANRTYEARFSRIFIVCATGRSAAEILGILRRRLGNDDAAELREAAEQQRQIAIIRLKKWLNS